MNSILWSVEATLLCVIAFFVGAFWLLAAGLFSVLVLVFLLLCLMGPRDHCDYLIGEEGAICFGFRWFVMSVLFVVFRLRFLFVPSLGYVLWLRFFLEILFTIYAVLRGDMNRATAFPTFNGCLCTQRRLRSACVFEQSDQCHRRVLSEKPRIQSVFMHTAKTPSSLRGGAGWSESSLSARAIL